MLLYLKTEKLHNLAVGKTRMKLFTVIYTATYTSNAKPSRLHRAEPSLRGHGVMPKTIAAVTAAGGR